MRRQVLHCLPSVGGGVCLCLFLLPVLGRSRDTPSLLPGCLPMREQGPADTVSLDVAKAINIPGFVCVRVLNGFSEQILADPQGVRLQKRKEGKKRDQSFQDFEPFPAGAKLPAGASLIPTRGVADWRLPRSGCKSGRTERESFCTLRIPIYAGRPCNRWHTCCQQEGS